ncbi:hypothetical protein CC2G_005264 [Coprinopsis cinerea AmutBmut pab1-1]|nr:hypothetical protein CC2G_005264 [Coprinopsis cinerea AmutBmut pab1-1]
MPLTEPIDTPQSTISFWEDIDNFYVPQSSYVPNEIWLHIFELLASNPGAHWHSASTTPRTVSAPSSSRRSPASQHHPTNSIQNPNQNSDTLLEYIITNESSLINKSPPGMFQDILSTNSVCRTWHHLSKPLLYEHVTITSAQRAQRLSALIDFMRLDPDGSRAGEEDGMNDACIPTHATKRLDIIWDANFRCLDLDLVIQCTDREIADYLSNILSTCPNLATLALIVPQEVDSTMLGALLSVFSTIPPGYLKRLELGLPFNVGPTLAFTLQTGRHLDSLEVLWLTMPALHMDHPVTLPRVHTLVLQYTGQGSSFPHHANTEHLNFLRLPTLQTSAVFIDPRLSTDRVFPNLPRIVRRTLQHLYCRTVPVGLGSAGWHRLQSLGISYEAFAKKGWKYTHVPTRIKSVMVSFKEGSLPRDNSLFPSVRTPGRLEENLYKLASRTCFPALKRLRLCLPYVSLEDGHEVPMRFPLLDNDEWYIWNERLEKLKMDIEFAISDDWWTASGWSKVSARAASEVLQCAETPKPYPMG